MKEAYSFFRVFKLSTAIAERIVMSATSPKVVTIGAPTGRVDIGAPSPPIVKITSFAVKSSSPLPPSVNCIVIVLLSSLTFIGISSQCGLVSFIVRPYAQYAASGGKSSSRSIVTFTVAPVPISEILQLKTPKGNAVFERGGSNDSFTRDAPTITPSETESHTVPIGVSIVAESITEIEI